MADEISSAVVAAPVVADVAAVSSAPAAVAAVPAAPSPEVVLAAPAAEVVTPAEGTPAVVEPAKDAAKDAAVVAEPAKDGAKPADAAAVVDPAADPAAVVDPDKPAEGAAAVVEPPKYGEFKVPETLKMDAAQLSAYTNILGKYGLSQEAGQELMDFGAASLKTAHEAMTQRQQDVWAETNRNWVAEFDKAAGNRRDTILNDVKSVVVDAIKNEKQRTAFWNALAVTGAGNHKDVIMGMHAVAKMFRERGAPSAGLPASKQNGSAPDRRYGKQT